MIKLASLRAYTPARVSLTRTGSSLSTSDTLNFALAHAHATRGRFQLIEVMLKRGETSNTLARFVAGFKAARAKMVLEELPVG